jgi:UDP-N-acetylglucosamine 4,6-dehydratase
MLNGKSILVTGGTGSFGNKFIETVLRRYQPDRLIVFSRDELKQYQMRERFADSEHPSIRYFLGDVRDRDRLYRAFDGVDIVVHAAALKQVLRASTTPSRPSRPTSWGRPTSSTRPSTGACAR